MKRIALIGGDENHVVTQSRLRGFREAYEKMGEVIDPTMLFLNLDNHVVIDKIDRKFCHKNYHFLTIRKCLLHKCKRMF